MNSRRNNTPISVPELVWYAWKYSPLYRTFWKKRGFNPEKHFRKTEDIKDIPVITKDDLAKVPLKARAFRDQTDWYYFPTLSGGTTRRPLVTLISSYAIPPYYTYAKDTLAERTSSVLIIRPQVYASAFLGGTYITKYFNEGSIIALGDVSNLPLSADLAKELETDFLIIRPSSAVTFVRSLNNVEYSPKNIKLVWLTGEPITNAARALIRELYPNAILLFSYAMTEGSSALGLRSSECTSLESHGPNAYHLNVDDYVFEEVSGSLVVTSLHKMPVPLIRYEVGDQISVVGSSECTCGFKAGLDAIVGSRKNTYSYKIGGFTFKSSEIERVLAKFKGKIGKDFILYIDQIAEHGKLLTIIRLVIHPLHTLDVMDIKKIEEGVRKETRVKNVQTIEHALVDGDLRFQNIELDDSIKGQVIVPPTEITNPFHA